MSGCYSGGRAPASQIQPTGRDALTSAGLGYDWPMTRSIPCWPVLACLIALGCANDEPEPDPLAEIRVHPECVQSAWVDLVVLDIWGRDVTSSAAKGPSSPGGRVPINPGQALAWEVSSEGLDPTALSAVWSGELTIDALTAEVSGTARVAVSRDVQDVGGRNCVVYGLFVGLDHPWYAAGGRAPQGGNDLSLLMDGEEYWAAVHADMMATAPATRVHQSTWWWHSDFELVRSDEHHLLSPSQRYGNTMMGLLEARTGINRVAVARFVEETAPGMAYLNTDPELRAKGADPDDNFEVMLQGNTTPAPIVGSYDVPALPFSFVARVRDNPNHAWRTFHQPVETIQAALLTAEVGSYHQKFMVIGSEMAFISGMNVKSTDWDSNLHLVFDHRRMEYGSSLDDRAAVMARQRLPDRGPRKDYGVRIYGPGAAAADDVLRRRWDLGLATGAMFAGDQTPYTLQPSQQPRGDVTVQVVATMPDPIQERAILETQVKACRQATDVIFIEDQYFRAPLLDEAILGAMEKNPALHLVVVTKNVGLTDGGKKWTVLSDQAYREAFGDRYLLLELYNFDREGDTVYFQAIDTHSKLLIVDDVYLSVGSANKNNRGFLFEGELNVAVHDPKWVSAQKNRVLANLVGPENAEAIIGKSGAEILAFLEALSESNAARRAALELDPAAEEIPEGFAYPLVFDPEWLLDVGPDLY